MEPDDNKTQTHAVPAKGAVAGYCRIVEKTGAGGMAEMCRAEDTELDQLRKLPPLEEILNDWDSHPPELSEKSST